MGELPLLEKLKALKRPIRTWNKKKFDSIDERKGMPEFEVAAIDQDTKNGILEETKEDSIDEPF